MTHCLTQHSLKRLVSEVKPHLLLLSLLNTYEKRADQLDELTGETQQSLTQIPLPSHYFLRKGKQFK